MVDCDNTALHPHVRSDSTRACDSARNVARSLAAKFRSMATCSPRPARSRAVCSKPSGHEFHRSCGEPRNPERSGVATGHGSRPFPDKSARLIRRSCFVLAKTLFQSVQKSCPDCLLLRRIEIAAAKRPPRHCQKLPIYLRRMLIGGSNLIHQSGTSAKGTSPALYSATCRNLSSWSGCARTFDNPASAGWLPSNGDTFNSSSVCAERPTGMGLHSKNTRRSSAFHSCDESASPRCNPSRRT